MSTVVNITPFQVVKVFAVYLILQILFVLGITAIYKVQPFVITPEFTALFQIACIIAFTLGVLLVVKRQGLSFAQTLFWEEKPQLAFTKEALTPIKLGMLSIFIAFPLSILVKEGISHMNSYFFSIESPKQAMAGGLLVLKETPLLFFSLAALVTLAGPLIEEVLFRGYLQSWLKKKWGRNLSLCATALIFAAVHFEAKLEWGNIEILGAILALALVLGYLREKTQTLWAPIGLHVIFNGMNAAFLWFGFI